jgi:hypothetical protein
MEASVEVAVRVCELHPTVPPVPATWDVTMTHADGEVHVTPQCNACVQELMWWVTECNEPSFAGPENVITEFKMVPLG